MALFSPVALLSLLVALLAARAHAESNATRGFLLAATRDPIARLAKKVSPRDELGAILRDICSTPYPARVVVADETERAAVASRRPCDKIEPWVLPAGRRRRRAQNLPLRHFKVAAVAANAALFPGGTLYVDNDIAVNRPLAGALFETFDDMARYRKAVGLTKAAKCEPAHHKLEDVPGDFCEHNGGVVFLDGSRRGAAIAREWLEALERHTSSDGHDQMPLRDVLWRHRDALLDLPPTLQCRCKKEDICASGALLWHLHRDDRRAATRAGTKRHGACVESKLTEWLVPSQAVAARHNATTELCGFFV